MPLIAAKGYTHPQVLETYTKARQLCDQLDDSSRLFPVLWGIWTCHRARLEMRTAQGLAEDLVGLAGTLNDKSRLLAAHHAQWTTHTYLGDAVAAHKHTARGIELYESKNHHSHVFIYGGHDPGVCGLSTHALNLWILGYPDQAVEYVNESRALADRLGHPPTVAHAITYSCLLSQFRRDFDAMLEQSAECTELAQQIEQPGYLAAASMLRGWAAAMTDQRTARTNTEVVKQGLATQQFMVAGVTRVYFLCLLADVYLQAGDTENCFSALETAIKEVANNGMSLWESEMHRAAGDALLLSSAEADGQAETSFRRAVDIAHTQKSKSLELRSTTSLCRLLQRENKLAEARAQLTPIYEWFSEGFDTQDLSDAKALLEQL